MGTHPVEHVLEMLLTTLTLDHDTLETTTVLPWLLLRPMAFVHCAYALGF